MDVRNLIKIIIKGYGMHILVVPTTQCIKSHGLGWKNSSSIYYSLYLGNIFTCIFHLKGVSGAPLAIN